MGQKKKRGKKGEGTYMFVCGNWRYRFWYTDEFEERKRATVTAPTKEECLEKAEAILLKVEYRKKNPNWNVTIPDLLREKFESDHKLNYTSGPGYWRNLQFLKIWEGHAISNIPIAEITPGQIELFLESIAEYSDSVIMKIYQQLRAAYRMAMEDGIVTRNLMITRTFRRPKTRSPKKKVRGLTRKEQQAFEEYIRTHKPLPGHNDFRPQMLIELHSGMRMGEINALKPENIDLEGGVIHVRSTISSDIDGRPFLKKGTKTENGVRDIPISASLRPVLEEALAKRVKNRYGLLFCTFRQKQLVTTAQVNSQYKQFLRAAGIEIRGQHSLRHTFATRCIEAGIPPVVLKTWLGHADIHMTLDIYTDVFNELHHDAIRKLDAYMDEQD